jgi:ubiquinone/menaquinone biosynthesis C-methylase UbiE
MEAALQELLRVLKPGGVLHFIEHGRAPDDAVRRWQHRIEPIQRRIAGGCHLTRRISETVVESGFTIENLETYYFEGEPKPFGYTFEGRARKT